MSEFMIILTMVLHPPPHPVLADTLSYSYTTNTIFEIRITGTTISFYVDNVHRHSRTVTQNYSLYYGSYVLPGAGVKDVEVIYDSYPSDVYNYKMEVHDLSLNCYSNNRLVDTHTLTLDDFPLYLKEISIV